MNRWLILSLIVVAGITGGIFFEDKLYKDWWNNVSMEGDKKMISNLASRKASFKDFSDFFADVAKEEGAVYAFELMREADLPNGIDTHLLGHTIGDVLYEQKGVDGMRWCTHDFRNACSHTIVIGTMLQYGDGAMPEIRQACHLAPGGKGAYTMCFHGLGHGVLAFNEYNMEKTIDMCNQFGTEEYNNREAVECFGGSIMEIIGGGGHDRENWEERRKEYLNTANPFGLCESEIVPSEFRPMCFNYMTPYVFESFDANMGYPGPEIFDKTFALCESIPSSWTDERRECFAGLGKEFIGIAIGRNYAAGVEPNSSQLGIMYSWCKLADSTEGEQYCVLSTMNSLYWGGERPYETALNYCGLIDNREVGDGCFKSLIQNVSHYIESDDYKTGFCQAIPEDYHSECTQELL